MLRAVGFTEDDWDKPQIAIADSGALAKYARAVGSAARGAVCG